MQMATNKRMARAADSLERALVERFGENAVPADDLICVALQIAKTPQGVVLFDRLVCAVRATKDEGLKL